MQRLNPLDRVTEHLRDHGLGVSSFTFASTKPVAPTGAETHLYTVEKESGEKTDVIETDIFGPIDSNAPAILDRWTEPGHRITKDEIPVTTITVTA